MPIQVCPKCKSSCRSLSYEGVVIEECLTCKGLWLDSGELESILQCRDAKFSTDFRNEVLRASKAGIPAAEQSAAVPCPVCHHSMAVVNFNYSSGIIINTCREHGAWFDPGELQKVEVHIEHWEQQKSAQGGALVSEASRAAEETVTQFQADLEGRDPFKLSLLFKLFGIKP